MEESRQATALVVGASGAIGGAVVEAFLRDGRYARVIAVSRRKPSLALPNTTWLQADHSEESLAEIAQQLDDPDLDLQRVVLATGVLHGEFFKPEKMLEQLDAQAMQHAFYVNTVVPALWLKTLTPVLKRATAGVVAATSARVGSISDNRMGGWYTYRSSKAALNMVLKSAAIEYRRRAPRVKLLAFHPGTTRSELSRPFLRGVPEDKLFTPEYVAVRLLSVMDEAHPDGELAYIDYKGDAIAW